ncbi:LysR family transcriptional regulator [Limibacillus halophilus]|uniref:LysR family transcriptional regulator n=1 Tax=Limibacillus halophilus TaxID=1579333 RepID=UPI001FE6AE0D|nr:LysR family transcriptional regulator [Limibacillus halophilus]
MHTFVVVAEEQSVSRAAEVLGRGQPAVSSALKKLEEQVGHKLAIRGPTAFSLTDAGKIIYREAREICGSIDRVSTLVADLTGELTGTVNLTIASHMTSPLIDRAFSEFHRRHPRATFATTIMTSPEIMASMADSTIYFGIGPVSTMRSEFEYFHIFKEHCGFYCGPGHRFFGVENLQLSDLENERAITYRAAVFSDVLQSITDMRHQAKFADPFVGVSNHMEEVRRMIITGLGIGPIPIHVAARDVRDGLMWRLPPYELVMPLDIYLITNPRVRPSRSEQAFIETLKEIVNATPYEQRVYPTAE